jgi:dihydrofolate reductase
MSKEFEIIVAVDENNAIGRAGEIPWYIPEDLRRFKDMTMKTSKGKYNAVIMGRKTYLSIPQKFRPLAGRLNIVLSQQKEISTELRDVKVMGSLDAALNHAWSNPEVDRVFIIGGETIYAEAIKSQSCKCIHLTRVYRKHSNCDAFFPSIPSDFYDATIAITSSEWNNSLRSTKNDSTLLYEFKYYARK